MSIEGSTPPANTASPAEQEAPKSIYLISYPKIVFMYPSLIAAIVAGVIIGVRGNDGADGVSQLVSLAFLGLFCANLVVLSFDFPRTTSLTFFFIGVAVFMGFWLFSTANPNFLPFMSDTIKALRPFANAKFYGILAVVLMLIYIAVAVSVQFDYWEVRPNELLHHHGVMSDMKRFPTLNMNVEKEINDLFEYLLLRSGRLILHPRGESRAVVLENVFFINKKEQQITKLLSYQQVRTDNS